MKLYASCKIHNVHGCRNSSEISCEQHVVGRKIKPQICKIYILQRAFNYNLSMMVAANALFFVYYFSQPFPFLSIVSNKVLYPLTTLLCKLPPNFPMKMEG